MSLRPLDLGGRAPDCDACFALLSKFKSPSGCCVASQCPAVHILTWHRVAPHDDDAILTCLQASRRHPCSRPLPPCQQPPVVQQLAQRRWRAATQPSVRSMPPAVTRQHPLEYPGEDCTPPAAAAHLRHAHPALTWLLTAAGQGFSSQLAGQLMWHRSAFLCEHA